MTKITLFLLILTTLMFSGCVNKRGISAKYYNDCNEYYDSKGYYHKDCDENLIEFEDVKKVFRSQDVNQEDNQTHGNVW
jgi:hypothetical protein